MTDCGVCLSAEYDCSSEFFRQSEHRAAKTHRCAECRKPIDVGQRYEYASGKCDGDFWTQKTCLVCAEIAEAFYCGGRSFGTLWEDMGDSEAYSQLNSSCFARLTTPQAKAELQRRWMEWKGLKA